MTVGQNDTLYAFRSDGIYAIDTAGGLIWNFNVPHEWENPQQLAAAGLCGRLFGERCRILPDDGRRGRLSPTSSRSRTGRWTT